MTHQLAFAARSDRGLIRSSNQDSVYAGNSLLVVADGMGGHAAGDMASRLVVTAFVPLDSRDSGGDLLRALAKATRDGNGSIAEVVHENPELDGMGTTVTALLFDGGRLGMAHVGDSRAYLYRSGVLHQLTHDDTFVQSLIDDGRITQEEAAHHPQRSLLLRALNGTDVDPSLTVREVTAGDRYLICSDGLPGVVSAEAIAETLANPDPGATADALIQLALVGGGPDNITVIVADVLDTGVGTGPTAAESTVDPDATGPIGTVEAVRMTAEMPRVPLPAIPEDVPARAEYVPADEDHLADRLDTDDREFAGPPPRRRSRRRRGAILGVAGVVLFAVAGLIGSFFWVRSQYYVGADAGQVVVYRGVDGSVLGLQLSTVQEGSCQPGLNGCAPLMVADLVPSAQAQVVAGIQAGTLDDARGVVTRLAGQLLPLCPAVSPPQITPPSTALSSVPSITVPSITLPSNTLPSNTVPSNTVPSTSLSGSFGTASASPQPSTAGTGPATAGAGGSAVPGARTGTTASSPGTALAAGDAAGSALAPGARTTVAPSPASRPAGSGATGVSANGGTGAGTGTTAAGSTPPTGTPLSSRAPEPGVTCRVVR